MVAAGDIAQLGFLAINPTTPPDVVEALLRHPDSGLRRRLAGRADLSHDQLLELAADRSVEVRTAVSVHPDLTEPERAGIAIDVTLDEADGHFGPRHRCHWSNAFQHVYHRVVPLADAVRWADSVNPLLRRRAARHPELPADLAASLVDDPDLGVRVLLALYHPDAPPELLLRCYRQYLGCGREMMAELPQFPTGGLASFADSGDPAERLLALRDPLAGPELVAWLCTDADAAVWQAAAACARLPVARIVELLDDSELAEHAAANPALPADRMDRIVETVTAG
ncbi:hypothetical protein [Actinoplanes sp. NPDC026619]|uniref:hypothetical protein n=1 Tax=Actinoplanes sp. NPDC026619 TaxID=3155798 RepID=UPI00340450F6